VSFEANLFVITLARLNLLRDPLRVLATLAVNEFTVWLERNPKGAQRFAKFRKGCVNC
jgi:hypothetical protein